jgi:hypothetical protein
LTREKFFSFHFPKHLCYLVGCISLHSRMCVLYRLFKDFQQL